MAEKVTSSVVKQDHIDTNGGHVSGGGMDNSCHLYFNHQYNGDYLGHLYERLSADIKTERKTEDTCEILSDFVATEENEVIGLESKLERGGMMGQLHYAKACKERYAKNLAKYSMYETAQVIHAYLLGKVESGFAASVQPMLGKIQPEQKLDLMRKAVLDPLENILGANPLGIHSKEVDGMAFFLTGKCKLKWEA